MKTLLTICAVVSLVLVTSSPTAEAVVLTNGSFENGPIGWDTIIPVGASVQTATSHPDYSNPGSSGTSTTYDYDALAVMVETITDMGGGKWKYDYTLTNNDSSSIWYCNVWFDQVPTSSSGLTTWAGHEGTWAIIDVSNISYYRLPGPLGQPFYIYTWGPDWPSGPDQIPAGTTWEGFSAQLNFYDPSPKQFGYMVNGHYWFSDHLDAVGWTIPEPGAVLLLGLGGVTLLRKRRT